MRNGSIQNYSRVLYAPSKGVVRINGNCFRFRERSSAVLGERDAVILAERPC